jgi:hypothetical protein
MCQDPSALKPVKAKINHVPEEGQGSGLKLSDLIDFGSSEVEKPMENQSRSPPPTFEEAERPVEKTIGGDTILDSKNDDTLLLEHAGMSLWFAFSLTFLTNYIDKSLLLSIFFCFLVATTLVTLSGKEKDPVDQQNASPSFGLGTNPSMLEHGTHYRLTNFLGEFQIKLSLLNV